jgi:UDP-glucose 4-epimerase
MTIGFTGARGFIGSYLLRHILSKKCGPVKVLLRNVRNGENYWAAEIIVGDLLSPVDCNHFADGLDVIFYLAHRNSPATSDQDPPNDALVNLVPLLNLLQAVRNAKNRPHIVYFSSGGGVYGPKSDRVPLRETDACSPCSSYGIQKLAAEHYLRVAADRGDLTCSVLRIGNAYGALLSRERMQGLIGVAVNNVLHNLPIRVFGNPANVRDYIHISDICALAEKVADRRELFTIVNAGSGCGYSVAEILSIIQSHAGVPLAIDHPGDRDCGKWLTDWAVLDITKARKEYAWNPLVDITAGIGGMLRTGVTNTAHQSLLPKRRV